jgi:phosphocarrier protein HPr
MTESRGLTDDCTDTPPSRDGAIIRVMRICNEKGLHARASAKFVQTVEKFEADVRVTRCGESVGGKSILGLMTLGAGPGTDITVDACGKDAEAVIAALDALISGRFGEEE